MSAVEKLSGDGFPRQVQMLPDISEDRGDRAHAKCIVLGDCDVVLTVLLSGQAHVAASLPREPVAQCRQSASKVVP